MGMSNATKNDALQCFLQGTDPSYRAGATQYIAYLQSASPDPADPLATECTYTGYARTAMTKASAWTDNGTNFTNAGTVSGGKRTDAGATQTINSFAIVDTVSGAVNMAIIGAMASPIPVGQNIKPVCEAGTMTITVTP